MKASRFLLSALLSGATLAASPAVADEGQMPALSGALGWLNSPPLTTASLRGKVVLVDFWTYTCINWLRTLPYLRAWADKYRDQGLVVIGVHSPEFDFERDADNVRQAVKDMNITYPVALDADHAVWRAFGNAYWPALYFVDARGRIRRHQFGEGDYEGAERAIQQLLAEAGATGVGRDLVAVAGDGAEAAADWNNLRSAENYLGLERTQNFASPGGAIPHSRHQYELPPRLRLNRWAVAGEWTLRADAATANGANTRLSYRFHARDLHLVMGAAIPGQPVRFRVTLDGKPPGNAHGADADEFGFGTLSGRRLYQLIRQKAPVVEREFVIEFLDPGAALYAFTFG
ncbi:MAG: thioredoxin family protein [Pseudomonadota bacterium]